MTQIAVQTQVDAIKKATEKASESRESAMKFLVDAGIIKQGKTDPKKIKEKK
jgi:hypothetical protein